MIELIIMMICGILFCFIGWRIWKKQHITLIHDYHYTKVSERDKKPYTEKMGKACIIMGSGMILTGIIDFISMTSYGWVCSVTCFIVGFSMILTAQKKYNGGLF